jgi:hypothetical protein
VPIGGEEIAKARWRLFLRASDVPVLVLLIHWGRRRLLRRPQRAFPFGALFDGDRVGGCDRWTGVR